MFTIEATTAATLTAFARRENRHPDLAALLPEVARVATLPLSSMPGQIRPGGRRASAGELTVEETVRLVLSKVNARLARGKQGIPGYLAIPAPEPVKAEAPAPVKAERLPASRYLTACVCGCGVWLAAPSPIRPAVVWHAEGARRARERARAKAKARES